MSKKVSFLLVVLVLLLCLTGCDNGGNTQTGEKTAAKNEEFSYVLNATGEYARIVRYNGENAEVTIPDMLGGKPVQEIGAYTFLNAPHVTAISIPASVKKIEDPSFYTLPLLKQITVSEESISYISVDSVLYHKKMGTIYCYPQGKEGDSYVIPDTVKGIGERAFYNSQLKEITFGAKSAKIYVGAFAESKLLTTVHFSSAVSQIYEEAFKNCVALTNVELPLSVTSIGKECFYGCKELESIVIPENVGVIQSKAFAACDKLASVEVKGKGVQRIAENTFEDDIALEKIIFASELMGIADRAFKNCISLKQIVLTEKLSSIGVEAFEGCSSLDGIQIPNSVNSIGAKAFKGTALLNSIADEFVIAGNGILLDYRGSATEVEIPNGVRSVSYVNSAITKVTIPEGVESLSASAFDGCATLETVILPGSLKSIGSECFAGCTSLKSFEIPESLKSIGDYCFRDCSALEYFTVNEKNVNFYTDQGILFDKIHKYLLCFPANSSVTSYRMAYGPTQIWLGAVQGVKKLQSFDASAAEDIVKLQDYAFADCPNLKEVKLTNTFAVFGAHTFENCVSLKKVDIQYTTTNIGESCFANCSSLDSIYLQSPIVKIGMNAFAGNSNVIKVDADSFAEEYCKAFGISYKK